MLHVFCGIFLRTDWWIAFYKEQVSSWITSSNYHKSHKIDYLDSPIVNEEWDKRKSHLLRFMKEVSKRDQRLYFIKYFFCEILGCTALVRLLIFLTSNSKILFYSFSQVLDMFIMHFVFNNFWFEYFPAIGALAGRNFTRFSQHSAKLFPTQAKCFYYDFGPSGSQQQRDALCFLPQNTINEKVFVFLYVWLIAMVCFALLNIIRIVIMVTLKCLRISDIRYKANSYCQRPSMDFFYFYSDIGYWFTLSLLHKNLSPVLFKDLISDLMKCKEKKNQNSLANDMITIAPSDFNDIA